MRKVDAIQKLCLEVLCNPETPSRDVMNQLSMSAGLIESDITQEGCDDWFERDVSETAGYIREKVGLCSPRTQDDVYVMLLKASGTPH